MALIISSGASEECGILQFTVTHLAQTLQDAQRVWHCHQNKAGTAGCARGGVADCAMCEAGIWLFLVLRLQKGAAHLLGINRMQ